MMIPLERFSSERITNMKIDAFFGDDLFFECNVPQEFLDSNIQWKLNDTLIDLDSHNFNFVVDKRMADNMTRLLVTTSFRLKNEEAIETVRFPLIVLNDYVFVHKMSDWNYFLLRFDRQLTRMGVCFIITSIFTIFFSIAGILTRNNGKK